MEIILGNTAALIARAQAIRYQVFTVEQAIPAALDQDGLDATADHALVMDGGQPVATARLVLNGDGTSVMARVAVLESWRGRGIASTLVNALMAHAEQRGVRSIEIHAHRYLRRYYARFGFEFITEVERVGDHQLIEMRYVPAAAEEPVRQLPARC